MCNKKNIISIVLLLVTFTLFVVSCPEPIVRTVKKIVLTPPTDENSSDMSNSNTITAFWGLPGIKFVNWRPNIHIKASSMNGELSNRVWDGTPDVDPDKWSLFEYSQILYYDSNFVGNNIQPNEDVTVDNEVIMPLAFEQKLYKRIIKDSTESPKYDVTWDKTNKAVVINLNTINSNYLILKPGARIAVFATQRPTQWGAVNDYSIIDAIPGNNSLQKSVNRDSIRDNTSDRKVTRDIGYIEYNGTEIDLTTDTKNYFNGLIWFDRIKVSQDKIILYIPNLETGNKAKNYWDNIDKTKIEPYMLFWIAIQQ
ncbi:MAG TPA: hypothetical protein PK771_06050 [Spirochaetota bacterium]|nr:hypothetical protein [Spirochaetota bacterium]